jgi:hypothetical protein
MFVRILIATKIIESVLFLGIAFSFGLFFGVLMWYLAQEDAK